ncbi:hypothetical protein [Hyalangium versicolor]|uniref:hypothetical protein n=1 Tax=Hyalangium versicolor TaxID=2861190 RepID=UPI001CCD3153|nr:hypothetical protein [Hyalangium versicolor]
MAGTKVLTVNAVRLSPETIQAFEAACGTALRSGDYWYDPLAGHWGEWGAPPFPRPLAPGLSLGGPLPFNASGGQTAVVVNGRALHPTEIMQLIARYGSPPVPGSYWLNASGDVFAQNGLFLFNVQGTPQRAPAPVMATGIDPEQGALVRGMDELMRLLRERGEEGQLNPDRQEVLASVVKEAQHRLLSRSTDPKATLRHMRTLIERVSALDQHSHPARPLPTGSRAEHLSAIAAELRRNLTVELVDARASLEDKQALTNLYERVAHADSELHEPRMINDRTALAYEREKLRQLALDVRTYSLRTHLMIAEPFWDFPPKPRDPNTVCFSGGEDVLRLIQPACAERGLKFSSSASNQDSGQGRWNQLCISNIAIFDLTVRPGPELAAVCYELGLAFALGRPALIVATLGQRLPFDVDVPPVELRGDGGDTHRLGEALDEVLYSQQRNVGRSALRETVNYALRRFGQGRGDWRTLGGLRALGEQPNPGGLEARGILETVLEHSRAGTLRLIHPSWVGHYPAPGEHRCFHVMPFRERWSAEAMVITEQECQQSGVRYIRGDRVQDPRINHSIWEEICRASHLVVDLTGYNANVALELGLADTLGRHTLIVGQGDTVERLFPALAKRRVHPYSLATEGAQLRELLATFLSPNSPESLEVPLGLE